MIITFVICGIIAITITILTGAILCLCWCTSIVCYSIYVLECLNCCFGETYKGEQIDSESEYRADYQSDSSNDAIVDRNGEMDPIDLNTDHNCSK